jgi:DNA polymerase III subunit chi
MTSIDFYFNAEDRLQVACRLAAKALKQRNRMLIYAADADTASRLDTMMWTWPAVGFVPHSMVNGPLAAETPVLIACGEETPADCELLLNLGGECPPHFERFTRLFEVVSSNEEDKTSGRRRYRFYQERGYPITNHDLAQSNE